jgi:hypothetical protein
MQKLHPTNLGYAAAIVSALCMLLLGLAGNLGIYQNAATMMQGWHMFFSPSLGGIIAGMLEAAIVAFIATYIFARIYNWLLSRSG